MVLFLIYFIPAKLLVLSEDSIVEQIKQRFESNLIYTYISDILISVNPFANIGLYNGNFFNQ